MKSLVISMLTALGSIALAIVCYLGLFWFAGWSAYTLGYNSPVGNALGTLAGILAPINFGAVVVIALAVLFFYLLCRRRRRARPLVPRED